MMWITGSGVVRSNSLRVGALEAEQTLRASSITIICRPRADAENRHSVLARIAHAADLALDTALAEAARDDDRIGLRAALGTALFQILGIDIIDLDLGLIGDRAVGDRLVQALVRIDRLTYLPTTAMFTVILGFCAVFTMRLPLASDWAAGPDVELLDHALVETFFVKVERHFVNALDVGRRDDAVLLDVAEVRDLRLELLVQRPVASA